MDLILYNPLSKNSKSNIYTHKLIQQYKKENKPFRLKSILKIKDIESFLENKDHIDNIILLGGDGTINKFINNIINLDVKQDIYLKSNGSGNDFLRTLKHQDNKPQEIMKATYDNGNVVYFMNGSGMGIDGYVGSLINTSKNKGKFHYMWNTLKAFVSYVPEPIKVIADGKTYEYKKAYLANCNNGRYFGGGMQITPKADLSSKELEVIIVHTVPKLFLFPIFFTIYVGLHTKFKRYVTAFKAKDIEIIYQTPQVSQTDGENEYDVQTMHVTAANKQIHLRLYDNIKSAE